MKRKIVYVGFAFTHHKGTHAGYHQIKDWINFDYVIDCQSFYEKCAKNKEELSILDRIRRKILYMILGVSSVPWYIAKIIWLGLIQGNLVFHFIYGENTFFSWIKYLVRKSNRFVCTFHQPVDFFKQNKRQLRLLKSSDMIILVGNTEVEIFKAITGKNNVVYIPHGISSDFYNVDMSIIKENIVLTVGNWLRDYEFADKVYSSLLEKDPTLEIHIVSNPTNKQYISLNPRIKFLSGISDEDLKLEYLKCSVLFLPLKRYTANNSLLEASSTGCNIVISSDFPDNSYIPEKYITITSMNVNNAVEAILRVRSYNHNLDLSGYIYKHYSWEYVANKTLDLFERI